MPVPIDPFHRSLKRLISPTRDEADACDAGTPGCCISHTDEADAYGPEFDSTCEAW